MTGGDRIRAAIAAHGSELPAINAEYVRVWSLRLDLEVIVGTAFVLLGQRATSPAVAEVPGQSHEPARMHR